jgi:hypothetical protein
MDVTFIEMEGFFKNGKNHSQGETLLENESWYKISSPEFESDTYPSFELESVPQNFDPIQPSSPNQPDTDPTRNSSPVPQTISPVMVRVSSDPRLSPSRDDLPGPNTSVTESSPVESEVPLDLWIELNIDQDNEQEQMIQSPLP